MIETQNPNRSALGFEVNPIDDPELFQPRPVHEWDIEDINAFALAESEKPKRNPIYGIVHGARFPYIPILPSKANNDTSRKSTPLDWALPSHGKRTNASCGSLFRAEINDHYIHGVVVRCGRLSCPTCYPSVVERMAENCRKNVIKYLTMFDDMENPELYHIVVSPPSDWSVSLMGTAEGYDKIRAKVRNVVTKFFDGGLSICHPWRQNKASREDDERSEISDSNTWRLGPHFHVLAYGKPPRAIDFAQFYEKTGWVIKVVGVDDPRMISDARVPVERLFPLLSYLISHTGVAYRPSGRSVYSVSYIGSWSKRAVNRVIHRVASDKTEKLAECGCSDVSCTVPLFDARDLKFWTRGYAPAIKRAVNVEVFTLLDPAVVDLMTANMNRDEKWVLFRTDERFRVFENGEPVEDPRPCPCNPIAKAMEISGRFPR